MEFSKKLFSTLKGTHGAEPGRVAEDATAFSEESLAALRLTISSPNISTATMKENMLRLVYGEMMGQDVQFGAIYALKLAQSGQTVAEKRAGYLTCYLLLQEGNELNIMLVNTLQKDLTSSNYHHVVVALVTLCNMTLPDVIPSMVSHVVAALSHSHESVRKRALIALRNFYVRQPEQVVPYLDQIKLALYDLEPSVMSAALGLVAIMVKDHAHDLKELAPVVVRILQQVVDNKLPKGYLYHGMSAPWIQIRCLQVMSYLGANDLSASKSMTPAILAAFHKARQGVDAAFGVLFEIIRTLNCLPTSIIVEMAQSRDIDQNPLLIIPRFAASSNPNLKFLGVSMLCQVHSDAWSNTWWSENLLSAVVEALESRDKTVQRKTLELLYRMLTLDNAENIIERLVHAFYEEQELETGVDVHSYNEEESKGEIVPGNEEGRSSRMPSQREKLLLQILDALDRFATSEEQFLTQIFGLLDNGGSVVTLQTAERILYIFDQGCQSTSIDKEKLRRIGVEKAIKILVDKDYSLSQQSRVSLPSVPAHSVLAYVVLWILGEYASDDIQGLPLSSVLLTLARCILKNNQDPLVLGYTLKAMVKVALKSAPTPVPTTITDLVRRQTGAFSRQAKLNSSASHLLCGVIASPSLLRYPLSAAFDVEQRAQEFLMVAELVS